MKVMGSRSRSYERNAFVGGRSVFDFDFIDFLFVIIELFRYLLRFRRCKRKFVEIGVF